MNKSHHRQCALLGLVLGFGVSTLTACSDSSPGEAAAQGGSGSEPSDVAGSDAGGSDVGGSDAGGSDSGRPTNSAILLAGQSVTPDDYLTYVGVLPEVPEGDVDFSKFREFGNANTYVHDGHVFVEQDGVMQRFDVDEDLKLVDGPRFSWADFGISTANASFTVFISATRAYTFAPQLDVIVIWDPSTMERTGSIELEYPERPAGMETWASDGYLLGDKVVWNVFSGSFETNLAYPAITLVVADAHTDAAPTFVEDSRCLPGGPSFVDAKGDYYVHGAGYFGFFYAYGDVPTGTRTCALRVKAGETSFDPDFRLDYEEATGSALNTFWINVSGDQYFTRAWDPSVPVPEIPDDFWSGAGLQPLLVDQSTGTSKPYPDLADATEVDGVTRIVDGVSYYQIADTSYDDVGGQSTIVELHPDGAHKKFHLAGFLQTLARVR